MEKYETRYNKALDKPKFKVGDWVVGANNICKIISLNNELNCYIAVTINNEEVKIPYYFDDGQGHMCSYHLWTIEDAKDGDVLVALPVKGQEWKEQVFIFKGVNSRDYIDNCIEYYCRVCDTGFCVNTTGYMGTTSSPLCPATKEQRDLLFQKIKEAGYEWDDEKKEMREVEDEPKNYKQQVMSEMADLVIDYIRQKSSWSEEDERIFGYALDMIEWYGGKNENKARLISDWLKSIKDRIKG